MEFKKLNPNSTSNPNPTPLRSLDMDSDDKRRRNRRCCLIIAAVLIGLALLLSLLGATVFKARRPITAVNSVALRNADISFDALRMNFHLNISLDAAISVTNPNKVGFRFSDSSAFVDYRGQVVGQAPIPAGKIAAGGTLPMNLTLTLMADRFLANSQSVFSDLISGTLPLSTNTRISGKVTVLFFKVHVVSYASCNLNISVVSRKIVNTDCTYKTRL